MTLLFKVSAIEALSYAPILTFEIEMFTCSAPEFCSMAAFYARIFVWKAMSFMSSIFSLIFWIAFFVLEINCLLCWTKLFELDTVLLADCVCLELLIIMDVIPSMVAVVSSTFEAWVEELLFRFWALLLIFNLSKTSCTPEGVKTGRFFS